MSNENWGRYRWATLIQYFKRTNRDMGATDDLRLWCINKQITWNYSNPLIWLGRELCKPENIFLIQYFSFICIYVNTFEQLTFLNVWRINKQISRKYNGRLIWLKRETYKPEINFWKKNYTFYLRLYNTFENFSSNQHQLILFKIFKWLL